MKADLHSWEFLGIPRNLRIPRNSQKAGNSFRKGYKQQPDDKSKINGSHNIVHLLISDRKLKYRKEIKVITTKSKHTDV